MAPLAPFVLKIKFYTPTPDNQSKNSSHIDYITRPGAVDYGDLEPESPTATPDTQAKEHGEDAGIHVKYMAERPRSEGLFSSDGPLDAAATKELLSKHKGIVWRAIVSLREDEAGRINHLEYSHWQESLQQALPQIAKEMGISESNFRWAAAYHPEPGHPHCHIVFWEDKPERVWGKLSDGERRGVKKAFVRNIYASERERLGIEKTFYRDEIKRGVRDVLGLKQAIAKESEVVRAEIGDLPGLPPRIAFRQREELGERLVALAAKMPGEGRTALGYMPPDVKDEVRKIADWLLEQPQFRLEVDKYLEAHMGYTGMYVQKSGQMEAARQKAYEDIRDRVCQDLLRGAVMLHRNNQEEFKEGKEWYRATYRLVERECLNTGVVKGGSPVPEKTSSEYQQIQETIRSLIPFISEDLKGRAVMAYLDDDLKERIRETADWLLKEETLADAIQKYLAEVSVMGRNADLAYADMRDRIAEDALAHAMRMREQEMPNIKMLLHPERRAIAIERFAAASANTVKSDFEEAKWTVAKMNEALAKMNVDENHRKEIVERFGAEVGLEQKNIDEVLKKDFSGDKVDFIGRAAWNRMRDNLGLHEHEMLTPWMGRLINPPQPDQEAKTKEPLNIPPPTLEQGRIPDVINTFKAATTNRGLNDDQDELRWTLWTASWVLKELGVADVERLNLLHEWVHSSGIEMSRAWVADMIDRSTLKAGDETQQPRWLGRDNWERLMKNIGAEQVPEIPWKHPGQFNLANTVWKAVWQTVQRERSKAEYQARYMQARELEERRRREGRTR